MIQKNNNYRVLKVFLDEPQKGFRLREISRLLNLGLPSVSKYVKDLMKDELIIKKESYGSVVYFGNRDNGLFKIYKRVETIRLIKESGLIEFIENELNMPVVVLYGSHASGEALDNSDIDLFVVSPVKKDLNIHKFEKKIDKELHIIINSEREFKNMIKKNKELVNNILNGIVLSGYLKVL